MAGDFFSKLRRAVGLKTLDERIAAAHRQVAEEEAWELQSFHHQRDLFAQELEGLRESEEAYTLGWYQTVLGDPLEVKVLPRDFLVHKYILGGSGCGKSCFLEHLIAQHLLRGEGAGLIDCHGDVYANLCRWVAYKTSGTAQEERERYLRERVVFVDLTNEERVIGLNPLAPLPGLGSDRQANQLLLIFRRFYQDTWGVKIEELARFSFMALIEAGGTLLDLEELLVDEEVRSRVLKRVTTPEVTRYFSTQLHADRQYIPSILNKLRPLVLDLQLKAVLGQRQSTLNFRQILDRKKLLLVNLSKSYLSANADLMGSFFVGLLQAAILSRRDTPPAQRQPFFLYVDEFQNYANEQLEEILSESRKYGLFLTMAHQTLAQLPHELQEVILGNADMQFLFRLSPPDGRALAPGNFAPTGRMPRTQLTPYETSAHPREQFYTEREELAQYGQILSSQPKRSLYYRHKDKPYKAQPLITADLPVLHKELGMSRNELEAWTQECGVSSMAAYTGEKRAVLAEIAQRQYAEENVAVPSAEKVKKVDRTIRGEKLAEIIPDIGDFKEK